MAPVTRSQTRNAAAAVAAGADQGVRDPRGVQREVVGGVDAALARMRAGIRALNLLLIEPDEQIRNIELRLPQIYVNGRRNNLVGVGEPSRNMPHPDPNSLRPPRRPVERNRLRYHCYICYRIYLEREPTAVPQCGHVFCRTCIYDEEQRQQQRGQQQPRCPWCLEDYTPGSLTRIYFG